MASTPQGGANKEVCHPARRVLKRAKTTHSLGTEQQGISALILIAILHSNVLWFSFGTTCSDALQRWRCSCEFINGQAAVEYVKEQLKATIIDQNVNNASPMQIYMQHCITLYT